MTRILTHTVHTGYEYEMTKIPGIEIHAVHLGQSVLPKEPWSYWMRPMPENYSIIGQAEDYNHWYDLIIVHTREGYEAFKDVPLPMIYKVHTIDQPHDVPAEIQERVSAFVFNQKEAVDAWRMDANRKFIIDHSIDFEFFKGWKGTADYVLTCGNYLANRQDKGTHNIIALDSMIDLLVLGGWNDDLNVRRKAEPENVETYLERIQLARAYFCPGPGFSMAALEAMATGCPIITMPTVNLQNFLRNGENCWIVNDVGEALDALKSIREKPEEAETITAQARYDVMKRYNPLQFQLAWDDIIKQLTKKQ